MKAVHANGYIENKVDFQENLSEPGSNSWDEAISCSSYSEEQQSQDDEENEQIIQMD
jgi:hypothetical protein